MRRRLGGQRGSALVVALFLLVVLELVLLAVAYRVGAGTRALLRDTERLRAFNAAEAGLAEAVQLLAADELGAGLRRELGTGSFEVDVETEGMEGPWTHVALTSSGLSGRTRQSLILRLATRPLGPSADPRRRQQLAFVSWEERPATVR